MRYKYCRLLVLIHINKALIDRQDPPLAIDLFIKNLLWVFLELDLDNDPNPLLLFPVPGPRSGNAWYEDAEEVQDLPALQDARVDYLVPRIILVYLTVGASRDVQTSEELSLPVLDFVYLERGVLKTAIEFTSY